MRVFVLVVSSTSPRELGPAAWRALLLVSPPLLVNDYAASFDMCLRLHSMFSFARELGDPAWRTLLAVSPLIGPLDRGPTLETVTVRS